MTDANNLKIVGDFTRPSIVIANRKGEELDVLYPREARVLAGRLMQVADDIEHLSKLQAGGTSE